MASPLDFINSDGFRKKLITRNLTPYAKSPSRPTQPINIEYIQSDTSVQDSPDQLIDTPSFANQLYSLNQYGNEGGYEQVPDTGALLNTKSNEGEYGFQDANIIDQSVIESQKWKPLNVFSNGNQLQLDSAPFFSSLNRPQTTNTSNNQPYPTTFVPSRYSPLSILLSNDPQGNNGLMSQDSFIVKLGAETLRREFEARIAAQIRQDTIGRANILNINSGTDLVNIIAGVVPIIEPNFTITVTANPILAAANFALRLGGSILPVSPIPGSYFDPNTSLRQPTTIQQMTRAFGQTGVGRFFNRLLGATNTGSQIMYNNMGPGQRSRLFKNIDFNRYKPNFQRSLIERIGGAITGTLTDNSNYYIGNITSEPSRIFSPGGDIPVNAYGQEMQSPVYGPQELAQLYEGPSQDIRLGANGPTYSNGGGIEGGFTWVSPKYRGNAGKRVGIGGEVTNEDEDFRPSSYNSTESTNREFTQGSILDQTQRLIDSQPAGGKRLQHVGNAIDQVSKVFHDGYKELTKGSRVYRYEGAVGQEVGTEYCRVFAKDVPYLQYNDLQKVDGVTTTGRRFSDSVLDNTFNLNISPNKMEGGQSSTNLINQGGNSGYAKKYMFSLENLAWRTSNAPGFSVSDLAMCERGPNGGRVMWFAPYGLTFTETVSTGWNANEFIGRPEPIYTYKSTSRTGSLNWKIVVDHPSVLNVIVDKVLGNETNRVRVDSIIDSFFAGCRKYDIYELAKKYYTIKPGELSQLQDLISSENATKEELIFAKNTLQTGNNAANAGSTPTTPTTLPSEFFKNYVQIAGYFENNTPKPGTDPNYETEYATYTSPSNIRTYSGKTNGESLNTFFNVVVTPNYDSLVELRTELRKQLTQFPVGSITITINASCSAPASVSYNRELARRRINSLVKFFTGSTELREFTTSSPQRLIVKGANRVAGEQTQVKKFNATTKTWSTGNLVNCTDGNENVRGGDTQAGSKDIFTTQAMSCRRAYIESIDVRELQEAPTTPVANRDEVLVGNVVKSTVKVPVVETVRTARNNITKRVLKSLLSECDYFETIKAETPMVYDNLKDKLKFFQPAFHSTTPEGLNSRLTFLQQCMRPGDTIPTVKQNTPQSKPTLEYNNATNTAFGAPPVLVLRVGDFYNTKILPDTLGITYEALDINPEGIGIQPMIANITLSFKFVGGSGLKESVDKLQNALTFNYYANTEMYDDNADVTAQEDFLKILDSEFLKQDTLLTPPALNQATPNPGQSNDSTVGTIITSTDLVGTGETGTLNYSTFMVDVVNNTQTYFTTVVNKVKESVSQYNNAVRQQWMLQRSYTRGEIAADEQNKVELFGKPSDVQKRFDEIFGEYETNITENKDPFIKYINSDVRGFSRAAKREINTNYVNFVRNKRASFQNGISTITQELTNVQQTYIQTLGKLSLIIYPNRLGQGTDGYQNKLGNVVVYATTGVNNAQQELIDDTVKIKNNIKEFNDVIFTKNSFTYGSNRYEGQLVFKTEDNGKSTEVNSTKVFIPFSKNPFFDDNVENYPYRRQYMIVSEDVLDEKKYESFKQSLIGNVINNKGLIGSGLSNFEEVFDAYWIGIAKPLFTEENTITNEFINNLEKTKLKNFLKYTPFDKKERVFNYTTESNEDDATKKAQQNMIKGLGASTNLNTNNNTWNDANGATGANTSKAKLN
jgi:hypothetical protein